MALSAQVRSVNPWHEKLAAWMLVHAGSPGWNKRASEEFKVTQAWISTVVHSDAFQDYYQRLRQDTDVPAIHNARERMLGTLDHAITLLQDKLESTPDLPVSGLLETIDVLAKRTGHSEGTKSSEGITNNILLVTRDQLAESRARMRGGAKPPLVLEASIEPPISSQADGT